MNISLICVALLGLLVIALGFTVSLGRTSSGTNFHYDPDPTDPLYKRVRAHGNAAEYAPILAILILALGMGGPAAWVEWVMMAAVLFRYVHAAGMLAGATLAEPNPLRFVGAVGTYLGGFVLVFALVTL